MRNLKRALSLGLTAAMISGLMVMGSSAASYADVTSEHNQEAIDVLEAVGIMIGDENGNFNPDQNVTRNEMAVIMSNLMEYNVASYKDTSPFTDVPSWAEPYVAACWTNGITSGYSDTIYGGSDDVTTAQAALMLMKALGYFQYSSDFGSDWQLATTRQGNAIDLFNGVDSGVTQAMTRNDVAQLVLNTLESGMVSATTSGNITVGGVTIATSVEYNYITSNAGYASSISSDRSTDANSDATQPIVELGEDLYQGDLTKEKDHDAFGRPAAIWSYQDDEIGTYVDDTTASWTTKVGERDLYRAAGTAAVNNYDWTIWQDGDVIDSSNDGYDLDRNDTDRWQTTGNGVLTEMFVDTVNETVDVTIIHSYVAEVIRVVANEDEGDYTVTVNYKTQPTATSMDREFDTETEFAEDDIVIINAAEGNIETMTLAETVEGTVSAVKNNDYLHIDGTPYNYNYAYTTGAVLNGYSDTNRGLYDLENNMPANPGAGDDITIYLDTNGCVVAIAEAGNTAEDYIYVKGIHQAYGDYSARVVHYDGSEETIDIDEIDNSTNFNASYDAANNVVDYTNADRLGLGVYQHNRSGSAYDLTSSYYLEDGVAEFRTEEMVLANDVRIENGRARIYENNGTDSWAVDSNTVFVDAYNNTSYTGYNNVPSMSGVEGWVVFDGDNAVADIVFITEDVEYEADNDSFFLVTSAGAEEEYNENGNVWNYTVFVEGVETTLTTSSDLSLDVGVYEITKYDSDGNVSDVDPVLSEADLLNVGANSTAYATYARGDSLTVKYPAQSDVSVSNNQKDRFVVDGETLIVVAWLNDDNTEIDDDTISVGQLSNISTADDDADRDSETSAVYVLNADDKDETTPTARLVLVINPDPNAGSQRPGYSNIDVNLSGTNVTVTWTGTTAPSIQNMVDAVENEIMATGYQYVNTTSGYNGGQLEYYFQPYNIINGITSFGPTYTFNTVTGVSHEITVTVGGTVMNVDSTDTLASIGLIGHVQVTDADGNVSYVDSANLAATTVVDGASYRTGFSKVTSSAVDANGQNIVAYGTPGASLAGILDGNYLQDGTEISTLTFPAVGSDADYSTGTDDGYYKVSLDMSGSDYEYYFKAGTTVDGTAMTGSGMNAGSLYWNGTTVQALGTGFEMPENDVALVASLRQITKTTTTLDDVSGLSYTWGGASTYQDASGNEYAQVGQEITLTVNLNGFTAATGTSTNLDATQTGVTPTVAAQGAVWGTDNAGATVAPASGTVDFNNGVSYTGTLVYTFTVDGTNNDMTVALS